MDPDPDPASQLQRHADRVVAFFDTEEGRYLQQRRSSNGQPPWSTFTPTDVRRMMHQVDELIAEAVRSAGGPSLV